MPEVVVSIPDVTNQEIQYYSLVHITGLTNTDAGARYESGTQTFHFYKTANEKAALGIKSMRLYADADAATTYVEVKSPTVVPTAYSLTWPAAAPAANQTLLAAVGGQFSWGTIAPVSGASTAFNPVVFDASGSLVAGGTLGDGQFLIGRTGLAPVVGGLTGTANQVQVATGVGSITLSLPQNIHSGASPTFAGLTLTAGLSVAGASALAALSATTGSFSSTLAVTGATSLSSTLTVNDIATFSSGVVASSSLAVAGAITNAGVAVPTISSASVFTNKTLGATNTLTGATAASFTNVGTITLPAVTSTLATLALAETLTNKTLTAPAITSATFSGGSIDNATVGATTRASGAFTTLAANGAVTLTSTLAVTDTATFSSSIVVGGVVRATDGTAAAPAYAFNSSGNTNTGWFLKATDSVGFSANGVEIGAYSSAGLWTLTSLTVAGATILSSTLAVTTSITVGGVAVPTISSTSTLSNKTLTSPVINGRVRLVSEDLGSGAGTYTDFAPTANASILRFTGATPTITGIASGQANGDVMYFTTVGSSLTTLTIVNDATSTAENRILTGTGANIVITGDGGAMLVYDGTSLRWRIVSISQ